MKKLITALVLAVCGTAFANSSPVGLWKVIDEDGKTERSLVRITESGGVLSGRIEKLLDGAPADARCDRCPGDLRGQPVLGMEILRNLRAEGSDSAVWGGGVIVDPSTGRIFRAQLKTVDGGQKLQARGSLGPLSRTQTWQRVE
jgi:uncharacterized protein (DUF2147 family)